MTSERAEPVVLIGHGQLDSYLSVLPLVSYTKGFVAGGLDDRTSALMLDVVVRAFGYRPVGLN